MHWNLDGSNFAVNSGIRQSTVFVNLRLDCRRTSENKTAVSRRQSVIAIIAQHAAVPCRKRAAVREALVHFLRRGPLVAALSNKLRTLERADVVFLGADDGIDEQQGRERFRMRCRGNDQGVSAHGMANTNAAAKVKTGSDRGGVFAERPPVIR